MKKFVLYTRNCIENEELCIQNDEFCIKNDELCRAKTPIDITFTPAMEFRTMETFETNGGGLFLKVLLLKMKALLLKNDDLGRPGDSHPPHLWALRCAISVDFLWIFSVLRRFCD